MAHSGAVHKILSVLLRLGQFAFAVIVLGILSRFCYLISIVEVYADGRIVYAMVVSGIAIVYSIFFCIPVDALFCGFPFDIVLFIMWLIAFCLLVTKTGSHTCSATWYNDYWGYYWGRFWRFGPVGSVSIDRVGCAQWRVVLAFSFIASMAHILSGILGLYVFHTYVKVDQAFQNVKKQARKISRSDPQTSNNISTGDTEHGMMNA